MYYIVLYGLLMCYLNEIIFWASFLTLPWAIDKFSDFQIMSKDMCATIDLLLTKRQQLMSAMTTLDKDKDSRQELRRNILLTMVNDTLSSLNDYDNDVTTMKKRALTLWKR